MPRPLSNLREATPEWGKEGTRNNSTLTRLSLTTNMITVWSTKVTHTKIHNGHQNSKRIIHKGLLRTCINLKIWKCHSMISSRASNQSWTNSKTKGASFQTSHFSKTMLLSSPATSLVATSTKDRPHIVSKNKLFMHFRGNLGKRTKVRPQGTGSFQWRLSRRTWLHLSLRESTKTSSGKDSPKVPWASLWLLQRVKRLLMVLKLWSTQGGRIR